MTEILIRRAGLNDADLENRVYEGVRKSSLPATRGQWNLHGRKYNIKGVYNLRGSPGIELIFDDGVGSDLKEYLVLCEQRKRERASNLNREV